jgi:hypothetical protein
MKKRYCRSSTVGIRSAIETLEERRLFSMPTSLSPVAIPSSPTSVVLHSEAIHAVAGEAFTAVVGTVSEFSTAASTSKLAASINWGDGSVATSGVLVESAGIFDIEGSHTYKSTSNSAAATTAAGATDAITVTVTRVPSGGVGTSIIPVGTIHSTAWVLGDDGGVTFNKTPAVTFTSVLGTFTSALLPAKMTATISWGDGETSIGQIVPVQGSSAAPTDEYEIIGTHSYAAIGSYAVHVSVTSSPVTATGTGATPPLLVNVAQIDSVIDVLPNATVTGPSA